MNTPRSFPALLLAIALSTLSCTDTDADRGHPLAPSDRSDFDGRAPFAGVAGSSIVSAQNAAHFSCPAVPPFLASFDVAVQARGSDLVLEQVQGVFVDVFGITAPAVTLPHPQLAVRFGSTRIPAASSRTFPMQFPFGCGTVGSGTLTLVFVMRDGFGAPHTSSAVVTVR
jgi:hypothetical protein